VSVDASRWGAAHPDITTAAAGLVDRLIADPWGRSSPSVYETGRLVSLAPWLSGHAARLRFLLAAQRPDGGWGLPHDGYALVPTLSATEALLRALGAPGASGGVPRADLIKAADQGLRRLSGLLAPGNDLDPPDMPAIEHITPYLVERINARLDGRTGPPAGLDSWRGAVPLRAPAGMTGTLLHHVRDLLRRGGPVPAKLLHALEIGDSAARSAPGVRPQSLGTVGASPAATADPGPAGGGPRTPKRESARRYLETAAARDGGPVPVATPITEFERGWTLGWLARAGVRVAVPPRLLDDLRAALGGAGTGGGAGLPPDADTSAGVLYALSLFGRPHPPDLLWEYETESHFCTWPGENGRSVTTNAHVLEAFGHFRETLKRGNGHRHAERYAATVSKVTAWLCEQQDADGAWRDRWHASPYYATACAVPALHRFGDGARSAQSVERAVRWVLETQRADGSWGRWDGTVEETAYAVQILLLPGQDDGSARSRGGETRARAAARGAAFLRSAMAVGAAGDPAPPDLQTEQTLSTYTKGYDIGLWHDKDVYHPTIIIHAAVLAALHLAKREPSVTMA
jgi:halimadienyl-diphosphate synthase